MRRFDVVVAGGGPAGAIAARELARAGAAVALVDGSHPREKSCGGGVTARALAMVEPVPADLDAASRRIASIRFEAGGRTAEVRLDHGETLDVFSRRDLDAALWRQAADAGSVHIASRIRTAARTRRVWSVETAAGDVITAPWLLGADGAGGVVRRRVFRPFGRRQLSIAAGAYVDGVERHDVVIRFIDQPSGYLWSFPRPGHLAVGACGQADETSAADMHGITDRWLDDYPPARGRPRRRYAWPIPSLSAEDIDREMPAGDGWLLLGDAAGLVDPITREGIFFALQSGLLAAQALRSDDPARTYTQAVRDELHGELRRAARLKAGFFRPRFTHLLIDALHESAAIRAVMVDLVAGRQPYRGLKRRLVRTLELGWALQIIWPRIHRAPER